MRLLQRSEAGEYSLTKTFATDETVPPYAILSHTWGADADEVTFDNLTNDTGKEKPGYKKIRFCGEQARQDDLHYFWIDTCCINKSDKAELSLAIRSMFCWYQNAAKCYVYLSDVSLRKRKASSMLEEFTWEPAFRSSRWFTRGWTLQELLAPSTVEFFSQEWERLGDKITLKTLIHKITSIPENVFDGASLSQFSVNERLGWKGDRQTKRDEDAWYSLSGIFNVEIAPAYNEGATSAFQRLMNEIQKGEKCMQDLYQTNPQDDKKRIEETKGGLLADSYRWVLNNITFRKWQQDQHSRLLWVKGDPGKGKTMLLCGIIDELHNSMHKTTLLSYFFCQATDSRINSATAVLRGLLYMLLKQQPSLLSHVRKKHDFAGKTLFEDANARIALMEIFVDILQDPSLRTMYLIIDALDECITDLPILLNFIAKQSSASDRVKWVVSSRNWPDIEEKLEQAGHKIRLSLELNAKSVGEAVDIFIQRKVDQLAQEKQYKEEIRRAVLQYLTLNANNTFLWVALVCQDLKATPKWNVLKKLAQFPPDLDDLYTRMMHQISESESAEMCQQVLASTAVLYRPVTIPELIALIELPENFDNHIESMREIISLCKSFLTLREDSVYFIHQSAKDFLFKDTLKTIFPQGTKAIHQVIFSKSLAILSRTLHRNMYNLGGLGTHIDEVELPELDPLAASRYPCIYWINHLYDSRLESQNLEIASVVEEFIKTKYLYWLEGLSLCKSMTNVSLVMAKLCSLVQEIWNMDELTKLVQDARRFIMYHKVVIETYPLQIYASAMLFSPTDSLIRWLFQHEKPEGIMIQPAMSDKWSACLQTLEGHIHNVNSVVFSHDSTQLVSASYDSTIKIWDASSGICLQTLKGHMYNVNSVVFSHDSTQLVSASWDTTIKIWDASSGMCLQTLKGHRSIVNSIAFSHDSTQLVSASWDTTIKLWDISSGECLQTLIGHSDNVNSIAFSHNSTLLASGSRDNTIKLWDISSGECLQTLIGHSDEVSSIAFSHDSTQLASASFDKTIKLWDIRSRKCLQTLIGHSDEVSSIAFSHDSTLLASTSRDTTVKLWNANSGTCLQTLLGHGGSNTSVAFSHDSTLLASASRDNTVKIWDMSNSVYIQTPVGHSACISSIAFSHDLTLLASGSRDIKLWDASSMVHLQTFIGHHSEINSIAFLYDNSTQFASGSSDTTVKLWDISSGACLQTFTGHSEEIISITFSYNNPTYLASASNDNTVKIWDASNGMCLQTLKGHRSGVNSVAFSHDSTQLASASCDQTIRLWDVGNGECLKTLKGHSDDIISVAFYETTLLASVSEDRIVKLWDMSSGACLQTIEDHVHLVDSVAFVHNLSQPVSASNDRIIKLWDPKSGACLCALSIGTSSRNLSFHPTSSGLDTKMDTINIHRLKSSSMTVMTDTAESKLSRYQGISIVPLSPWITYAGQNILWVPSEYRPFCMSVGGTKLGLGVESGKVWICSIDPRYIQKYLQ